MNQHATSNSNYYPIGETAKRLNVSIKTLRRWDSSGLIHSKRNERNQRLFNLSELEHFKTSQNNNSQIYSITQAANYLKLSVKTLRRWEKAGRIKAYRNERNQRIFMASDVYQAKQLTSSYTSIPLSSSSYNYFKPHLSVGLLAIPTLIVSFSISILKPLSDPDKYISKSSDRAISVVSTVLPTQTESQPYSQLDSPALELASQAKSKELESINLVVEAPPSPSSLDTVSDQINNINSNIDINANINNVVDHNQSTSSAQLIIALLSTAKDLLNIYKDVVIPQNLQSFDSTTSLTDTNQLSSSAASLSNSYLNHDGNLVQTTENEALEKVESEDYLSGNEVFGVGIVQATYPLSTSLSSGEYTIHLTFKSDYSPATRYWITQDTNTFTLHLDAPVSTPAAFSWIAVPQ